MTRWLRTASGRQHPVQHRHAAGSGFDQRTAVGGGLPGQSPSFSDHLEMVITLCGRIRSAAGHGRRARRDRHLNILAVRTRAFDGTLRPLLTRNDRRLADPCFIASYTKFSAGSGARQPLFQ